MLNVASRVGKALPTCVPVASPDLMAAASEQGGFNDVASKEEATKRATQTTLEC
jgi:hypothetical protein